MPQYVPILKSKAAEYWAWQHASAGVVASSRPVFEVVKNNGLSQDLAAFVRNIARGWPGTGVLTVDTGYLDQTQPVAGTTARAVLWASAALDQQGVKAKPVMRLYDPPAVLAEVATAAALHGEGACLRLGSPDSDPSADEAANMWPNVHEETNLTSFEIDLLIDFNYIRDSRDVARAVPVADQVVQWACQNGPWRSVTIASGAFPNSISNLPVGMATPVRRYDADFFSGVVALNPPIALDFGDYGIWHPAMLPPAPRGPLPNLRYTYQGEWQIYRESRALPGNESFFTLCTRVVSSNYWPASGAQYSAGDAEIERCAQSRGGPGGATQWLQWGASHHFEHVVERLSTQRVP